MVRKINAKLVLRLRAEGFSLRQIEAQGISQHSSIKPGFTDADSRLVISRVQ